MLCSVKVDYIIILVIGQQQNSMVDNVVRNAPYGTDFTERRRWSFGKTDDTVKLNNTGR